MRRRSTLSSRCARTRPLGAVILAAALLGSLDARAQTPDPDLMQPRHEIAPISRLTVATVAQLVQNGHDEASMAPPAGAATRRSLVTGGAAYALLDAGATEAPRRMRAPSGSGLAYLVKVPLPASGYEPAHTYYALASAVGSKICVWAFYDDLPGDPELLKKMTAVLAKLETPKLVFDPKIAAPAG